ncbi:aspartyl-phosphate phosphatase Spo0E family protein [Aneurinibacillus sp. Ricciae_BoGa-3]|uniref:aspartyl-phosphate phosphatase Spo0E family protein n=1 Tax=Aneurinibacillus sp. Ricciae_BoGa-3 TaxID=3022697 RepID=UPI002341CCB9|nr:aspartyl-phosphate phosphatase Spo0E family protein [Aneurinibacillus sp. Ricciae_BoGa-3]WCK53133.1 aspartyl-phosphate phosphatase Spo0E family protein [Aneurinibacillus sp. Ricciae_BoGa-3]
MEQVTKCDKILFTMDCDHLATEIADLRDKMHKIASKKNSLTHPSVVAISQLLDTKLNDFSKITCSRSHNQVTVI